jgi:exopolysaccharide biosynthesis polyprenyl glycosylphosphotransferase
MDFGQTTGSGGSVAVQVDYVAAPASSHRVHQPHVRSLAGAAWLLRLETSFPLLVLVGVMVLSNMRSAPGGVDGFLSTRVTVKNVLLCAVFVAGWSAILRLFRLYDCRVVQRWAVETWRILAACTLGVALAGIVPLTSASGGVDGRILLLSGATSTAVMLVVRAIRRMVANRRKLPKRVVIVGTGLRALRVWGQLAGDESTTWDLAGFVDSADAPGASVEIEQRRLGTVEDLERLLMQEAVDEVFITLPIKSHYREIQETILVCERVGVRTKYDADMFSTSVAWPRVDPGGSPVVTMNVTADDYRLVVKRSIDLAGALVAIVLFAPVMVIAAIAIKATSRGPVLFAQDRHGLNKRPFRMLKFRTMVVDAAQLQQALEQLNEVEGPVFKIFDDPRVTRVGRILRKTSIDELPQLFNVVKGEMSLVGPRPLPLRDVQRFTRAADMRRFSVRPGLTCLWQISGRSHVQFSEWVRLDLLYIDRWSLAEDLRILVKTIPAVLRGSGAS